MNRKRLRSSDERKSFVPFDEASTDDAVKNGARKRIRCAPAKSRSVRCCRCKKQEESSTHHNNNNDNEANNDKDNKIDNKNDDATLHNTETGTFLSARVPAKRITVLNRNNSENSKEQQQIHDFQRDREDLAKRDDDDNSWFARRIQRLRRLRQLLPEHDDGSFDPDDFGMKIDFRFGDCDSNRYADAFAVSVDPARCRRDEKERNKKLRKRAENNVSKNTLITTTTTTSTTKICKETCKKIRMALKVIPLIDAEACYMNSPFTFAALRHSAWTEYLAMMLCAELVDAHRTPSLPYLIRKYSCSQSFSSLAERQRTYQPAIVLCNELATGGNLLQWADRKKRQTSTEWHACLFHLFVAMYALQRHCALTHHDLHLENVLLMRTDEDDGEEDDGERVERDDESAKKEERREEKEKREKKRFWQYCVDDQLYFVPDCGFLPVLWDFGIAYRPEVCENVAFSHVHPQDENDRNCSDASQLLTILAEMREDGEISIPSSTWKHYDEILSWQTFSMRYAIPFAFGRLFTRKPPAEATLLEPVFTCGVNDSRIVPSNDKIREFFL